MVFGGFDKKELNGVVYYAVSFLERTGRVRAAFTTRLGGVSTGETATMNFGARRKDTADNVRENYRRICRAVGFTVEGLCVSRQVHGTAVHEPLEQEIGRGVYDGEESVEADGLMTARRGVALVKHSADCVPVYILDTATPAIAMVHAGWRGTLEGIAAEALARMAQACHTRPQDCLAAIGPAIGPCCFVVGADVAGLFQDRFPGRGIVREGESGSSVDLWRCNALQLIEAGLPEGNIAISGLCTACDTGTFYSHRKEQGKTGAMAAIIELV